MVNLGEKPKSHLSHSVHDPINQRQVDGTMRKYQQLALTIVAIVSLVAFLFYKHEYERLRYTLEYLDTFGEAPANEDSVRPQCGSNTRHKISTPPVDWVQVTTDLEVYSSFWDDQNGIGEPQIRTIAAVRKSAMAPSSIGCSLWFESEEIPVSGSCLVELASERLHGHKAHEEEVEVIFLLCTADNKKLMLSKVAYMIQFFVDDLALSNPVYIHESESLKTISERSAVCIIPVESPVSTLKVIEFIAFYNIIGVEKFSVYGPVLPPLSRKLLDKYSDEIGVEYEEKQFSVSKDFKLTEPVVKKVIELDCIYRHRDTHENLLILSLNQYVILGFKPTLQETVAVALGRSGVNREVAEFHLTSQKVCIDKEHSLKGKLLLSQQTHTGGPLKEVGVAILRPHLLTYSYIGLGGSSTSSSQHISAATAVVHHYDECLNAVKHEDMHHLPVNNQFVEKLQKSLLYRKWLIQ